MAQLEDAAFQQGQEAVPVPVPSDVVRGVLTATDGKFPTGYLVSMKAADAFNSGGLDDQLVTKLSTIWDDMLLDPTGEGVAQPRPDPQYRVYRNGSASRAEYHIGEIWETVRMEAKVKSFPIPTFDFGLRVLAYADSLIENNPHVHDGVPYGGAGQGREGRQDGQEG